MGDTKKYMIEYWEKEIEKRKKNNASDFKIKLANNQLRAWKKINIQ